MSRKATIRCKVCRLDHPVETHPFVPHLNRRDKMCPGCRATRPPTRLAPPEERRPPVGVCVDCGGRCARYADRCKPCAGRTRGPVKHFDVLPPNPGGYCLCGCGLKTGIAKATQPSKGMVKGHHVRFCPGHQARTHPQTYVVEDRGYVTECHIWQGFIDKNGYGRTADGRPAHRKAYEEKHGKVPDDLKMDHLCRIHPCRNPDHVEPVTDAINAQRGLQAKITADEVRRIRALYAAGNRSQQSIADEYAMTQANISDIVRRETWRNVE